MADHEREYGLVMPFVVCQSKGGPYDDAAFVSGYRLGSADARLAGGQVIEGEPFLLEDLPQLDLIAMRHGCQMRADSPASEAPEWTTVTARPAEKENVDD